MREKDIDKVFKQKLSSLEVPPPDKVWAGIEGGLNAAARRRGIVLWWRWSAAAVVFLAGLFFLWPDPQSPSDSQLVRQSSTPLEQGIDKADSGGDSKAQLTEKGIRQNEDAAKVESYPLKNNYLEPAIAVAEDRQPSASYHGVDKTALEPENGRGDRLAAVPGLMEPRRIASIGRAGLPEKQLVADDERSHEELSTASLLAFLNKEEDIKNEFRMQVKVGGEYSPTYAFRDVSGNNAVSGRSSDYSEGGLMTGSGGIKVSVQMHRRWSVESGVRYAMLGQEVTAPARREQFFTQAGETGKNISLRNIDLQNSMGAIQTPEVGKTPALAPTFNGTLSDRFVELDASSSDYSSVDVEQLLGYLEVPLTVRYNLLQRAISISLSGGLSTNWLVDNSAYLYQPGRKSDLGRTEGIADVSFSTHAGLALSLPIYGPFNLQVEPRFSYFLSDINGSFPASFKPYSFGVFTGIFYSFGGK